MRMRKWVNGKLIGKRDMKKENVFEKKLLNLISQRIKNLFAKGMIMKITICGSLKFSKEILSIQ
jgi:hypothetical protein